MRNADKHRGSVALAAAAAIALGGTHAAAQPVQDPGAAKGILGWSETSDHQVTLITGDVVQVSVVGGKTSVASHDYAETMDHYDIEVSGGSSDLTLGVYDRQY